MMKKKLLTALLVLVLLICVLPMAVAAEGCPGHQWTMTNDTATCASPGVSSWLCTLCGHTTTEASPINTSNHTGSNLTGTDAPTCTAAGANHYSCACGGSTWSTPIPALDHSWKVVERVEPTCLNGGKDGYEDSECDRDGCSETKHVVLPKLRHNWDAGVEQVKPTCTTAGSKLFTCGGCNLQTTESINALDHNWIVVDKKDPTCLNGGEDGYEDSKCDRDGCSETKHVVLPKLRHNWDAGVEQVKPTCTTPGSKLFTCSGCNLQTTEPVDALDHDWKVVDKKDPTCLNGGEDGYEDSECKREGCDETKHVVLPKLRHNWDAGVEQVKPTCTTSGSKLFTCSGCNLQTTEPVAALKHTWDAGKVTKAATCHSDGVMTYTCTRDAKHTKTEKIPAHGYHRYVVTKDKQYHYTFCINDGCKESYMESHSYGRWKVVRTATPEKKGVLKKTCKYCDHALWTNYVYTDNPPTGDAVVFPAMLLLTSGAALIPTVYTGRKRRK